MSIKKEIRAVIYPEQKKIACVLLQTIFGGNSHIPSRYFDSDIWELSPETPGAQMFFGTAEQWQQLGNKWNKEYKDARATSN